MAALIAMPVVGFALLMVMALYEDRMLPRNATAGAPEREPGEPPEPSAPRPAFGLITDPRLARGRSNCRVRHADARPVRRSHAPAAHEADRGAPAVAREPAAPPVEIPGTVPYPVPGPLPGGPGDVA